MEIDDPDSDCVFIVMAIARGPVVVVAERDTTCDPLSHLTARGFFRQIAAARRDIKPANLRNLLVTVPRRSSRGNFEEHHRWRHPVFPSTAMCLPIPGLVFILHIRLNNKSSIIFTV